MRLDPESVKAAMRPYLGGATSTGGVENITAAFGATAAVDLQVSRWNNLESGYERLTSMVNKGLPPERRFHNPVVEWRARQKLVTGAATSGGGRAGFLAGVTPFLLYAGEGKAPVSLEDYQQLFWQRYEQERNADPGRFADALENRFAFNDEVNARAKAADDYARQVQERADGWGVVGAFAGSAAAHLTDPPNLAAMALGAPAGWGIVSRIGAEMLIGGGIEALLQPGVQTYREQLGLEHGFGPALANVATASVGAGGFTAGLSVLGLAVRGGYRAVERKLGRGLTETERAAVDYVKRELEMQGESPYPANDPKATAAHAAAYDQALDAAKVGEPWRGEPPRARVTKPGRVRDETVEVEINGARFTVTSRRAEIGPPTARLRAAASDQGDAQLAEAQQLERERASAAAGEAGRPAEDLDAGDVAAAETRIDASAVPAQIAERVRKLFQDPKVRAARVYVRTLRQTLEGRDQLGIDVRMRFGITRDQLEAARSPEALEAMEPGLRNRVTEAAEEMERQGATFNEAATRQAAGTTARAVKRVEQFEAETGADLFEVADAIGLGDNARRGATRSAGAGDAAGDAAEAGGGTAEPATPSVTARAGGQEIGPDDPKLTETEIARMGDQELEDLVTSERDPLTGEWMTGVEVRARMDEMDQSARELQLCLFGGAE